jgi:hypothetical protein
MDGYLDSHGHVSVSELIEAISCQITSRIDWIIINNYQLIGVEIIDDCSMAGPNLRSN